MASQSLSLRSFTENFLTGQSRDLTWDLQHCRPCSVPLTYRPSPIASNTLTWFVWPYFMTYQKVCAIKMIRNIRRCFKRGRTTDQGGQHLFGMTESQAYPIKESQVAGDMKVSSRIRAAGASLKRQGRQRRSWFSVRCWFPMFSWFLSLSFAQGQGGGTHKKRKAKLFKPQGTRRLREVL